MIESSAQSRHLLAQISKSRGEALEKTLAEADFAHEAQHAVEPLRRDTNGKTFFTSRRRRSGLCPGNINCISNRRRWNCRRGGLLLARRFRFRPGAFPRLKGMPNLVEMAQATVDGCPVHFLGLLAQFIENIF